MNGRIKRHTLCFILFFWFCFFSVRAQSIVLGLVTDSNNTSVSGVTVLATTYNGKKVVKYAFTNEKGEFKLRIESPKDSIILSLSSLGYKTIDTLLVVDKKLKTNLSFVLKEKTISLKEVHIKASKPITVKKDTIVYNVNSFLKGNEAVVEEVLKNLPGINVGDDGTIKVQGREVEKVMVEGDDFFKKGYTVLTKNMPSNAIKSVEVLKKYSNNRLLKGVENSNKVALNLKLKEEAKQVWFGNLQPGYGLVSENRYEVSSNAMSFGKKNKFYLLSAFNNIGANFSGKSSSYFNSANINSIDELGYRQNNHQFINLEATPLQFKKERFSFNNEELFSLNSIFNLDDKTKVKANFYGNLDELSFFRNTNTKYVLNDINATSEKYSLRKENMFFSGEITFEKNISLNSMFKSVTKYGDSRFLSNGNASFNSESFNDKLRTEKNYVDQYLEYTHKFKGGNKVLVTKAKVLVDELSQDFVSNEFTYDELFQSQRNAKGLQQLYTNEMKFVGVSLDYLYRAKNKGVFKLSFGNEFREDDLTSSFAILKEIQNDYPEGYQNTVNYSINNLFFASSYLFNFNKFSVRAGLDTDFLFRRLKGDSSKNDQKLFLKPSLMVNYKLNKKNRLYASFNVRRENAVLPQMVSSFLYTGFRVFQKSNSDFKSTKANVYNLGYQYGDWESSLMMGFDFTYVKEDNFFTTNSQIDMTYALVESIMLDDKKSYALNLNIENYVDFISSLVKFNASFSKQQYKNIVNTGDLRFIESKGGNFGIQLRSSFNGFFNYHISSSWFGSVVQSSKRNSFINNTSFLDLYFNFNKKTKAVLTAERYVMGDINKDKRMYNFFDAKFDYDVVPNKFSFSLVAKNLLNKKEYNSSFINDFSNAITFYRLQPRYVMFKMNYRF